MFKCEPGVQATVAQGVGCLCCRPEVLAATRRISAALSRRGFVVGAGASIASLGLPRRAIAQAASPPPIVLTNLRLFDGKSASLRQGLSVLVRGERIEGVAATETGAPEGARKIDCGNRIVMPGLIDAHWHSVFAALPLSSIFAADVGYIFLSASAEAERTLMRGFTTVRDLGGPSFPLKQAIDEGTVAGPRIYPSGAVITTTGGHGDLRPLQDVPRSPGGPLSAIEQSGGAMIADSADEVRLRVREQFFQGASQIKLVGGGGVSSPRTALDMTTFSEAEVRAGVESAADWNTYVTVHAYAPFTIQRATAAGARCIEHAHLMDEPTARLMAEKDIWLSIQPFVSDEDTVPLTGQSRVNMLQVLAGTNTAYLLARTYKLKTAFGSDLLFSARLTARQGIMLTHLARWYSNPEILTMATAANAELLALSGPRNPYGGKLGVIEVGALADLLVVDGDPLTDITLVANPDRNFLLIMKDGKIYKNTLPS
jgi:imidazolonepropionase-like amidohydrolase